MQGAAPLVVAALIAAGAAAANTGPEPRSAGTHTGPEPRGEGPADAGGADAGSDGCGDGPAPCPLRTWMKAHAGAAARSGDLQALAAAFDAIDGFAPEVAYATWRSIARDGAAAARRGDAASARAACRGCHEQHRAKYRAELRSREIR